MKLNPDNAYDSLAKNYDAILHSDPGNKAVRDYVKATSLKYIAKKSISLDFGGGTGQDILWLSEHTDRLLFCEPSGNMRLIAEEFIKNRQLKNVSIVDEPDFKKWSFDTIPKKESVDFILSNFAVFNSIYEIDLLFEQLSQCLKKDGTLVISVLHGFPEEYKGIRVLKKIINKFRFKLIEKSFVLKSPVHNTIIHSHKKIVSSSKKHFRCLSYNKVLKSMFTLYIFKKK